MRTSSTTCFVIHGVKAWSNEAKKGGYDREHPGTSQALVVEPKGLDQRAGFWTFADFGDVMKRLLPAGH